MKLTIKGVYPYDGVWEINGQWTNREWAILKRISGELPGTVDEKLRGYDPSVITAIAVIALRRSGRFERIDEDVLWDAETPSFTLDLRDEDEEAAGADPLPEREPETRGMPSGSPSTDGLVTPAESPPSIGLPSSDTPAYDQETSRT